MMHIHEPKKRRGRPITGSPKKGADGLWTIRIPIPGTNRTKVRKLEPHVQTEERASEVARRCHELYLENPEALTAADKPADMMSNGEYLAAWTDERKGRIEEAENVKADLLRHVFSDEGLKNKRCALTTPEDLRKVVARLDTKVELGEMRWTTARAIWSGCRTMFKETVSHKVESLRIRKDDPTSGVKGTEAGDDRAKAVLYPDELTTLLNSDALSIHARRLWALLTYLGLRVSELAALEWSAVDLRGRRIVVHRSIDRKAKKEDGEPKATKSTKTGQTREIDIFDPILPLLVALQSETRGVGRVFRFEPGKVAIQLQEEIRKAGLTRSALLTTDETRQRLRAQDLRATCATWLGLCEQLDDGGRSIVGTRVSAAYASEHLGHKSRLTTEKHYLRGKGLRIHHVGMPFPPLPAALLGSGSPGIPAKLTCKTNGGAMQTTETVSNSASRKSTMHTRRGSLGATNGHETRLIDDPASDRIEPVRPRSQVDSTEYPPGVAQEIGAFEMALADALQRAAVDRRYDIVAQLARELEARRVARQAPEIVSLESHRKRADR